MFKYIIKGIKGVCPKCDMKTLFHNKFKVNDKCRDCGLTFLSNDDGTWFFLLLIDRAFFIFPLVVLMYFGFEPLIFVFVALVLGSIFVFASSLRLGIAVAIDYYFNSKSSKDKYISTREKNNKKN